MPRLIYSFLFKNENIIKIRKFCKIWFPLNFSLLKIIIPLKNNSRWTIQSIRTKYWKLFAVIYKPNNKFKKKEKITTNIENERVQTVYTIPNIRNTRPIIDIHKYAAKIHFHFPPHIDLQIHFHNIPMEKSNEKREDKNSIIRAETSGRRKFGEIKIVFARVECRQETDRMEAQS